MKKFIPNIAIIDRGNKNTSKSETVPLSKLQKPFRVIDGKIVEIDFKQSK